MNLPDLNEIKNEWSHDQLVAEFYKHVPHSAQGWEDTVSMLVSAMDTDNLRQIIIGFVSALKNK
ncbi:MAG TPA: hypothetical protein EYQ21_07195 [Flavobacteriales bacterium]|jgi:hypothetical protein|nr:hypothetical protein [Flavobacteriales bacterium]